jgi:hypothetical protein
VARDYFVAIYEEGGGLHLAGFPSSEASYREWEKEFLEYERTRLRSPGKAITGGKSDVGREAMPISVFEVGRASSIGLIAASFILTDAD